MCLAIRLVPALDTHSLRSYPWQMELNLTREQEAFIQEAIASGRFRHREDVIQDALALWEERERRRTEILSAVDEAESSLARGQGLPITEHSIRDVANEVKSRGRDRLASKS